MRTWRMFSLVLAAALIAMSLSAQKSNPTVPKYNKGAEAVFTGAVEEMKGRACPVSGGIGSHIILKLSAGSTIEVHLAATKFVKQYELVFQKGDVIVTGLKVKFEDVDTIFARKNPARQR